MYRGEWIGESVFIGRLGCCYLRGMENLCEKKFILDSYFRCVKLELIFVLEKKIKISYILGYWNNVLFFIVFLFGNLFYFIFLIFKRILCK